MNAMLAESDSHNAWLEPLFDVAFAAPGGAIRLRQLILVLAMQGKLVPQRASEATASELLKQVAEERSALVKAGKIRAPKEANPIADSEKPYAISKGWEWARLSEFVEYNGRGNIDPDKIEKQAWVLDLEDIEKGTSKLLYRATYAERSSKSTKSVFKAGDVLYGKLRPYLDKVIVADSDGVCTTEIVPIVPSKAVIPEFLCWQLKRPAFLAHVNSLMYGVKMPRLGTDDANSSIHPLPPLEEQRRIVARIGELMSRCDELESLRSAQESKRREARAAALRQWLAGDAAAAVLMGEHFATLVSTREDVAELRKVILQLAVMGKLAVQNPADTPASEMLKQIAAEKTALVKVGKIRDQKALSPIAHSEMSHTIPRNWEWARLQDVTALVTDGDHQPPPKAMKGVPFLVIGNLNTGVVNFDGCRFVPNEYFGALDWGRKPSRGDILYSVTGSFGITIPVDTDEAFCVQRHVAIFKSAKSTPAVYLAHFLRSAGAEDFAERIATGIAQKTVPLSGLRGMPIPLPPVEEQKRIVARIDTLMHLCDTLEQGMDTAKAKQVEFLDAVMARA